MSSYLQQRFELTEKHLLEAHQQEPQLPRYLMGLATYYIQFEKPVEALKYIKPLVKSDPRNQGYQSLLTKAQSMINSLPQDSTEDSSPVGENQPESQPDKTESRTEKQ